MIPQGGVFLDTAPHERAAVDSSLQRLRSALESCARDIAAVPDLHNIDNQSIVFDGIDDSVGTLSYPVAIAPG